MLPTRKDKACKCPQLGVNKKRPHTRARESVHSTPPVQFPPAIRLQSARRGQSNCSQTHISGNMKLRSVRRQCQSGSANTDQSFFQDRRLLLSTQLASLPADAAAGPALASQKWHEWKEFEAPFRQKAALAAELAPAELLVSAPPAGRRISAPGGTRVQSTPQPALSAPSSRREACPRAHPEADLGGWPCAYTNSSIVRSKVPVWIHSRCLTRLAATSTLSWKPHTSVRGTLRRPMATTEPKLLENNSISLTGALMEGLKQRVQHVQDYSILAAQSVSNLFQPPYYWTDILEQMDIIGVGSLPIVVLTGFFIGAVMVLQTAAQFIRFGQTALTADAVSLALVRELGPSISGLLVTGRNGSSIASELGSMVVTEQVDAMRAMGTDPTRKLVTPRMVATVLMLPLLTAMADLAGLIGGFGGSTFTLRLRGVAFWTPALDAPD